MNNNTNKLLDAALTYADRGWQIFPATRSKTGYSIAKRGIDTGTPWGRTSDPEVLRSYWKRIPNAGIGLAMGAISGVFDVETDTIAGHSDLSQDGATSLAALEKKHGKLPATLSFVSPSGSVHRLFKHPGNGFHVEHSTSKLGIGIDVIGDGFMSVVPPSRKGKGRYEWINGLPIARAPKWLLELVVKPAPAPRAAVSDEELPARETVILALALLPNDNPNSNWDFWKDIGLRIYASTGGTGFDLFDAWSREHRSYNAAYTSRAWKNEIATCPPDRYGPRAILNKIEEVMPEWQTATMTPTYDAQIKRFLELLDEKERTQS